MGSSLDIFLFHLECVRKVWYEEKVLFWSGAHLPGAYPTNSERSSRLKRFIEEEEKVFILKNALGFSWRCKFYYAGVVTDDRWIGSWFKAR
jgi:hypothetical protein